jgi:hypothetical protein
VAGHICVDMLECCDLLDTFTRKLSGPYSSAHDLVPIETAASFGALVTACVAAAQQPGGADCRATVTELGKQLMALLAAWRDRSLHVLMLAGRAAAAVEVGPSTLPATIAAVRTQIESVRERAVSVVLPSSAELVVLCEVVQRLSAHASAAVTAASSPLASTSPSSTPTRIPPLAASVFKLTFDGDAEANELSAAIQLAGHVMAATIKAYIDHIGAVREDPATAHDLPRVSHLARRARALGLAFVCVAAASVAFANSHRSLARLVACIVVAVHVHARVTRTSLRLAEHDNGPVTAAAGVGVNQATESSYPEQRLGSSADKQTARPPTVFLSSSPDDARLAQSTLSSSAHLTVLSESPSAGAFGPLSSRNSSVSVLPDAGSASASGPKASPLQRSTNRLSSLVPRVHTALSTLERLARARDATGVTTAAIRAGLVQHATELAILSIQRVFANGSAKREMDELPWLHVDQAR